MAAAVVGSAAAAAAVAAASSGLVIMFCSFSPLVQQKKSSLFLFKYFFFPLINWEVEGCRNGVGLLLSSLLLLIILSQDRPDGAELFSFWEREGGWKSFPHTQKSKLFDGVSFLSFFFFFSSD